MAVYQYGSMAVWQYISISVYQYISIAVYQYSSIDSIVHHRQQHRLTALLTAAPLRYSQLPHCATHSCITTLLTAVAHCTSSLHCLTALTHRSAKSARRCLMSPRSRTLELLPQHESLGLYGTQCQTCKCSVSCAKPQQCTQWRTVGEAAKMLVSSHQCTFVFASRGAICALKDRQGCFGET